MGLGIPLATLLGFVWMSVDADDLSPGATPMSKLTEAFLGLVGIPGPVAFTNSGAADRTSIALAVLGTAVLLLFVLLALQPAAGPKGYGLAAALRANLKAAADLTGLSSEWLA